MTNDENSAPSDQTAQPGKMRTWWHPLLVRLLDHVLATAYSVEEEVPVGRMPMRVDIVLIRRQAGRLSAAARRDLGVLASLLNRFTLVEFKGPTDALETGDLAQLAGCAFLWHSQQKERVPQAELTLIILTPRMNGPFREDLQSLGWRAEERESGVFAVLGAPWTMWLVETDAMAERGEPVLTLVSHVLLDESERIIKALNETGCTPLLSYALQQIHQFRALGEDFVMQHTETEYMGELEEDLKMAVLAAIPREDILQVLTPEDRLRGLEPEDRLRGLGPEDRLRGLSEEELDQMRELLERRRKS